MMFGHDDSTNNQDAPQHNATLDNDAVAQHDNDSPAYTPATPQQDTPAPEETTLSSPVTTASDDLLNIKQSALKQLSPLVGHLDQTPEEKFRTTMMMIQASDDQSLIKDAYAAAQAIGDEKTKAQALLDIINEINYFTQHS